MTSWQLLRTLITARRHSARHFMLRRRPPSPFGQWVSNHPYLLLLLGLSAGAATPLLLLDVHILLIALALVGVLGLLLGLTLAPVVVEEREKRTWETLRATPYSLEALVLGKTASALWWLQRLLGIIGAALILGSLWVGLGSALAMPSRPLAVDPSAPGNYALCGAALILPPLLGLLFLADRAQQFVLMVLAALAVSASTRTRHAARPLAPAAALTAAAVDIAVSGLILALITGSVMGRSGVRLVSLATLGPTVNYLELLPAAAALVAIGLTLAARETAVQALWRWTLRAAKEP
jgi:hypothetical protein